MEDNYKYILRPLQQHRTHGLHVEKHQQQEKDHCHHYKNGMGASTVKWTTPNSCLALSEVFHSFI